MVQHFMRHEDPAVPSNMTEGKQAFPDFPWKEDFMLCGTKNQPETLTEIR